MGKLEVKRCREFHRRCSSYPGHVLPPSVDVVLHPAQHGAVHFLLRGNVEVVTGDQIQDLGRKEEGTPILSASKNM